MTESHDTSSSNAGLAPSTARRSHGLFRGRPLADLTSAIERATFITSRSLRLDYEKLAWKHEDPYALWSTTMDDPFEAEIANTLGQAVEELTSRESQPQGSVVYSITPHLESVSEVGIATVSVRWEVAVQPSGDNVGSGDAEQVPTSGCQQMTTGAWTFTLIRQDDPMKDWVVTATGPTDGGSIEVPEEA